MSSSPSGRPRLSQESPGPPLPHRRLVKQTPTSFKNVLVEEIKRTHVIKSQPWRTDVPVNYSVTKWDVRTWCFLCGPPQGILGPKPLTPDTTGSPCLLLRASLCFYWKSHTKIPSLYFSVHCSTSYRGDRLPKGGYGAPGGAEREGSPDPSPGNPPAPRGSEPGLRKGPQAQTQLGPHPPWARPADRSRTHLGAFFWLSQLAGTLQKPPYDSGLPAGGVGNDLTWYPGSESGGERGHSALWNSNRPSAHRDSRPPASLRSKQRKAFLGQVHCGVGAHPGWRRLGQARIDYRKAI